MLVTTGCLLGAARCQRGSIHDSGAYLLVQPCGPDRRPRGTVIGIGPVLTRADAAVVAAWLADGSLDAARLHPRLRAPVRLPWPVHPRGPASQDGTRARAGRAAPGPADGADRGKPAGLRASRRSAPATRQAGAGRAQCSS